MFGFLEKTSEYLVGLMLDGDSMSMKGFNFVKPLVKPPVKARRIPARVSDCPRRSAGILLVLLGTAIIRFVITYIGKMLRVLIVGCAREILYQHAWIWMRPFSGIFPHTVLV